MEWGCFPREVLERGDSRDIQELIAFAELEPFGDQWRQTAQITAATWNTQLKPEDRYKTEQFMPLPQVDDLDEPEEEEVEQRTVEEIRASLVSIGIPVVVSTNGNN